MQFNTTNYPIVTPVAADTVLLRQNASGRIRSTTVASLSSAVAGVATVDSVAALKAISVDGLADNAVAIVLGYNEPGDGGGGQFFYNQSSVALNNGGTIISPDVGDGRWLRAFSGPIDVAWFGAVGDGATDDTAAINAAITAVDNEGGGMIVAPRVYRVFDQVNACSNLVIDGLGSGVLLAKAGNTTKYIVRGEDVDNVLFRSIKIEGAGVAGVESVWFSDSNDIKFEKCEVIKAGTLGLSFTTCTFVVISGCSLSSNYFYGAQLKDCINCRVENNLCSQNGETGSATSAFGRGVVLWRCVDSVVAFNRFVANTEYGFRIYSELADTSSSQGNRIIGNYFRDNAAADFVLYDESQAGLLVLKNTISDNIAVRTTNASLGVVYVLHGGQNTFVNNHAYKEGDFSADCAFGFYYAMDCTMVGCSANRFDIGLSFTGSERICVDDFTGDGVKKGATVFVEDISIKNSTFTYGGSGTSVALDLLAPVPTGKVWLEGITMRNYNTGISIGDNAVAVTRCTSINSGSSGLIKTGTNLSVQEFANNSFDTMLDFRLGSLQKTLGGNNIATHSYPVEPNTGALAWAVGDVCVNSAPVVGNPKGWRCTVAGAPGTWVSEGNL